MDDPASVPAATLDITLDLCPMTFVKTKLELEDLRPGEVLEVFLRQGEPLENVTRSSEEEGHRVLTKDPALERGAGIWRLTIRCGGEG
ncbi:MAG: sulfurtransferase TusA family protein [Sumerlaeia bacterium]